MASIMFWKVSNMARDLMPNVFPPRAPRKQAIPHRSPSRADLEPGRVYTLSFGMNGSPDSNELSQFDTFGSIPSSFSTAGSKSSLERKSQCIDGHLMPLLSGGNDVSPKDVAIVRTVATQFRNAPQSLNSPTSKEPDLSTSYSLADQYLDTMVMDDVWRAACVEKIHQNQRRQEALRRFTVKPTNARCRISSVVPASRPNKPKKLSHVNLKPKIAKQITSLYHKKPASPPGSDSGFVSCSPTPPPTYLRVRSTRKCPLNNPSATISIDIPASMVGRSCLSCGCTNTTCWRRTLGGIICNSCGLRNPRI
jgi:hypothetical protein